MRHQTPTVNRLLFLLIGLSLHCGEDEQSRQSQCDDITSSAHRDLTLADANLSCSTDADCALVAMAVSCLPGCGNKIAVSDASSVIARVQSVESGLCVDHEQLGCPGPMTTPCPPPATGEIAVCDSGRCEVQIQR
jgi:hypothetical protein